ncbi:MAG: caspase family protein [Bacteroidetes bacterium]|nr:caspase family protein [Bacteroidota bacterium]
MKKIVKHLWLFGIILYFQQLAIAQEPRLVLPAIGGRPASALMVQNGKYLFLGSGDFGSIWETSGGHMLLTQKPGWWAAVEAPDKRTVALVKNHRVYFFDLEDFRVTDSVRIDQLAALAYAADGSLYAAINYRGSRVIALVDRQLKDKVDIFSTTDYKPGSNTVLSISRDGRYALLEPEKSPAQLIDLQNRSLIQSINEPKSRFYFMPGGKLAAIEETAEYQYIFKVLHVPSLREEFRFNGSTRSLPFSHGKNTFWLDDNRLMVCQEETSAVVDFGRRSVSPDFKYHSTYAPASVHTAGRVSQGVTQTVLRIITYPGNKIEEWDIRTEQYRKIREIGASVISPYYTSLAPDRFSIQLGKKKEATLGRTVMFRKITAQNDKSVYSPDGQFRYHFGNATIFSKYKVTDPSGKSIAWLTNGINEPVYSVKLNKRGNIACLVTSIGTYVVDADKMEFLREVRVGKDGEFTIDIDLGCFIDNDTKFVAVGKFTDNTFKTYCFNVATGAILWSVPGRNTHFRQTPEGILCFNRDEQQIKWLNPQNGSTMRTQDLGGPIGRNAPTILTISISPDNKQIIYTVNEKLFFYDIAKKNRVAAEFNESQSSFWSVQYFPHNPTFAISVGDDGRIMLWNTKSFQRLATLYFFNDTDDWVCMAPGGRFDGSQSALNRLYYVLGKEVIPLERLFDRYFTPGLLGQIIGDKSPAPPTPPDEENIKRLKRPPVIALRYEDKQRNLVVDDDIPTYNTSSSEITLIADATALEDVIVEIRLFHNGKRTDGNTRNLVIDDDDRSQRLSRTFVVSLNAGENHFKAVALNSQRTESVPAELKIIYTPQRPAPPSPPGSLSDMNLYMVVVGINQYKNPRYNLNYALSDATAFSNSLKQNASKLFKNIVLELVTDQNASKDGILQAFERVRAKCEAKDVFVFYYAGHGVIAGDKMFYLVPHDVTQLYGNDEALARNGISANMLKQLATGIKAQKQLFVLDACQSAGALEQAALRGAAEEKAIAQLARATGTHWLTASGSDQFAAEFSQLGHGVFTYTLLEALKGSADNGDNKITVKEIDAYLQQMVPELSARYKGSPQYPASYGFGNDFPLAIPR